MFCFPFERIVASGSSRCSSQPPSTRRVGSGKLHGTSTCGRQFMERLGGHGAWERGVGGGRTKLVWHQPETKLSDEACSETRGSFDSSSSASSFTPGLFRLRLRGWRWGRARLIGRTISSKPAGTPNDAAVRHEAPKGRGHTEEGVWGQAHPCFRRHRSFAVPRRRCAPPRALGCWPRS